MCMAEKENIILKAAFAVLSRYGISKATVNDIAAEAGVSRQTIYNVYGGRDGVVCAVVENMFDVNLKDVRAAWETVDTLDAKLTIFCEAGPLAWYDAIHASPHAADLIEGLNSVAQEQMVAADQAWVAAIAEQIEAHRGPAGREFDSTEIADMFYVSAVQAKYKADSRPQLERRLLLLRRSILAMLDDD